MSGRYKYEFQFNSRGNIRYLIVIDTLTNRYTILASMIIFDGKNDEIYNADKTMLKHYKPLMEQYYGIK